MVWLDPFINDSNHVFEKRLRELKGLISSVNLFQNPDECIRFIDGIHDFTIFMIVSGGLGKSTVPQIHDRKQLGSIYVFCEYAEYNKPWAEKFSKIKGVYTTHEPILEALEKDAMRCDQDSVSISVHGIDASFMYTQLFKEALSNEQDDDDNTKIKEFVEYCRSQTNFKEDQISLFEQSYQRFSAIYWYTAPYFIFSTLNHALRALDVDLIMKMSFYIRRLQKDIEAGFSRNTLKSFFTVYRGQGLSNDDFNKLRKTKKRYMSFNSFLSTTMKERVATNFSCEALDMVNNSNVGIVFVMTIDPSLCKSTPFIQVNDTGYYKSKEEEIIFSTHTIFRIGRIEQMKEGDGRLWRIYLTLTSNEDTDLTRIIESKRRELAGINPKCRLGQLMILVGQPDKAKKFYERLLQKADNEGDQAYYNHQLGGACAAMGEPENAIEHYKKALAINESKRTINYMHVASEYQGIGAAYHMMKRFDKALLSYQKALTAKERVLNPNQKDWIGIFNAMASLHSEMGNYRDALELLEKSFEICRRERISYDKQLADAYHCKATIQAKLGNFKDVEALLNEALRIQKKMLPSAHPSFADLYNSIGCIYHSISRYNKAAEFLNKALKICQERLPPDSIKLGDLYVNLGVVCLKKQDYKNAAESYEKALKIYEKRYPSSHPELKHCEKQLKFAKSHTKNEPNTRDHRYK